MKITVFTSNQPRHISLIESLTGIADQVFAIQECNTVFPGQIADFFHKSPVMQKYFARVIDAERQIFRSVRPLPAGARSLPIKMGDLTRLTTDDLADALESDLYVVFGASFIKGPLCDFLVSRQAINIHMGVSPYYRGSSTNFWAMYDRRPQYVGATIHRLSTGLDSGPMLFHALPKSEAADSFIIGMKAVRAAHCALVEQLRNGMLLKMDPVAQDRSRELRYTRNADFTDAVAEEFLGRSPTPTEMQTALAARRADDYLRPVIC